MLKVLTLWQRLYRQRSQNCSMPPKNQANLNFIFRYLCKFPTNFKNLKAHWQKKMMYRYFISHNKQEKLNVKIHKNMDIHHPCQQEACLGHALRVQHSSHSIEFSFSMSFPGQNHHVLSVFMFLQPCISPSTMALSVKFLRSWFPLTLSFHFSLSSSIDYFP